MRASISLANHLDLNQIQKFWYRIYVTEMHRHTDDPLADHQNKTLHDPLTAVAKVFVARNPANEIVATLMTTVTGDADCGKYEQLYGLDRLSPSERACSNITTKFMVDPTYRRTRLPILLATHSYEHELRNGVRHDYIDCNDHLVDFFKRMGYRTHLGRVHHRDYGIVNSMTLDLDDVDRLREVKSPFLKVNNRVHAELEQVAREADHAA